MGLKVFSFGMFLGTFSVPPVFRYKWRFLNSSTKNDFALICEIFALLLPKEAGNLPKRGPSGNYFVFIFLFCSQYLFFLMATRKSRTPVLFQLTGSETAHSAGRLPMRIIDFILIAVKFACI